MASNLVRIKKRSNQHRRTNTNQQKSGVGDINGQKNAQTYLRQFKVILKAKVCKLFSNDDESDTILKFEPHLVNLRLNELD